MTARRPNVPRAGRPAHGPGQPPGADQAADGGHRTAPRSPDPVPHASAPGRGAGPSAAKNQHAPSPRKPSTPRSPGPSATKDPRTGGWTPDPGHAAGGTPDGASPRSPRQVSAPEERAAERAQLAGSIRRGRLGSRRVESPIQPAEEATPIPAKAFSGRLLALALVLVAVIVLLAPSVSRYVQQQAELDALRADIAVQEQAQAEHRSELARWDDPAFVKQQARERIFLVMPGETRYLVKGGAGIEDGTGEGSADEPADLPWADSLWDSITRAATD